MGQRAVGPSLLDEQIARELVSAALAGLPEVQREAIALAYFGGLTCEEFAVHARTPLGTIKSRLRSALKTMKRTLSKPRLSPPPEPVQRFATLKSILITEQLLARGCRQRGSQGEAECLHTPRAGCEGFPEAADKLVLENGD
jgi:hypothetical protein